MNRFMPAINSVENRPGRIPPIQAASAMGAINSTPGRLGPRNIRATITSTVASTAARYGRRFCLNRMMARDIKTYSADRLPGTVEIAPEY